MSVSSTSLLLSAVLAAAAASGAQFADQDEHNTTIADCVAVPEGAFANGQLTLAPGDIFCLSITVRADEVIVAPVTKPASKKDVLLIKFAREAGTQNHNLFVTNGSEYIIKYHADFRAGHSADWESTSICPVMAGISGIEMWSDPIRQLRLSAFRILPESGDMTCN